MIKNYVPISNLGSGTFFVWGQAGFWRWAVEVLINYKTFGFDEAGGMAHRLSFT